MSRKRCKPSDWKGEKGRRLRWRLAERDGSRCFYCTTPFDDPATATLDHYLPYWLWPHNRKWNVVLACYPCNQAKGGALPWPLVWLILARTRRAAATPEVYPAAA